MRKEINPVIFYVLSSLYIINVIQCVYFAISKNLATIELLTYWTLYMNSVYLLLNVISDSLFFFTKNENMEYLNSFSRNKMAQIVNPFSYFVFFFYWTAVLMGKNVMPFPLEIDKLLSSILHHFMITLFLILDLFLHEHDQITFNLFDVCIISCIFVGYGITIAINHFSFGRSPYPFMNGLSPVYLILIAIGGFGAMVVSYLLHIGLLQLKHRCLNTNKISDDGNKDVLISNN